MQVKVSKVSPAGDAGADPDNQASMAIQVPLSPADRALDHDLQQAVGRVRTVCRLLEVGYRFDDRDAAANTQALREAWQLLDDQLKRWMPVFKAVSAEARAAGDGEQAKP